MSDAYISEVVIVLEDLSTEQTQIVVEKLKSAGMEVWRVDDDQSVVEGAIEAHKAHDLKHVENVRYVRSVFTYAADYPPGDPRDRDATP